jgi:hypothetical protein
LFFSIMRYGNYLGKAKYLARQKYAILHLFPRVLTHALSPVFSYDKYHLVVFDLVLAHNTVDIKGDISNTRVLTIENAGNFESLVTGN